MENLFYSIVNLSLGCICFLAMRESGFKLNDRHISPIILGPMALLTLIWGIMFMYRFIVQLF